MRRGEVRHGEVALDESDVGAEPRWMIVMQADDWPAFPDVVVLVSTSDKRPIGERGAHRFEVLIQAGDFGFTEDSRIDCRRAYTFRRHVVEGADLRGQLDEPTMQSVDLAFGRGLQLSQGPRGPEPNPLLPGLEP